VSALDKARRTAPRKHSEVPGVIKIFRFFDAITRISIIVTVNKNEFKPIPAL
jgi:hypothetical protein